MRLIPQCREVVHSIAWRSCRVQALEAELLQSKRAEQTAAQQLTELRRQLPAQEDRIRVLQEQLHGLRHENET